VRCLALRCGVNAVLFWRQLHRRNVPTWDKCVSRALLTYLPVTVIIACVYTKDEACLVASVTANSRCIAFVAFIATWFYHVSFQQPRYLHLHDTGRIRNRLSSMISIQQSVEGPRDSSYNLRVLRHRKLKLNRSVHTWLTLKSLRIWIRLVPSMSQNVSDTQ